ncbi:lysine-specific histone demethylase [Coccidioides immitis RMSCC 3703]|uniref:Lysine-specific histone demethylase n=1 Tax=Coccidioides immitis RMSCC 3703 TaxID=454286 RepID=A0A0J8QV49_COCIT|nr:lysine-specific histone demethylase [Coccidioides immitis RMSCC 3703]
MDGSASINAESSSETVKSVESEIPPTKTKSSIEVDGGVSGSRDLPAPVALTKTATSESEDGKMGILTSNDGFYGDDRKNEVGSNQLTDMFPLSTSYPEDDSSQGSSELCKELGRFSESHDTPNGSTTSASLISPFSTEKSITPSAQLNQTLTTPPASAPVSAPPSSRKKQQQPPLSSHTEARPRSSIPTRMAPTLYAEQCIAAAYASRLNPYALHKDEQEILQDPLCHLHVTTYLNIRNGILRLWTRNPMLKVTEEEALGCAKDRRWMNLASVAYDWLVRNGYINFGCVSISKNPCPTKRRRRREGPTIVVIGAGMAGLGCARQLESLFQHYDGDTAPAKVIVLEGRKRIGGRIYSHPLQSLKPGTLVPNLRPTAEMGAQIIVGFENGASNADTLLLDEVAGATKTQTLGAVMDEAIRQCHKWLPLTPKDMRLLNWHYANLEYANAANLGKLSLAGWDQDMGNEFEGEHAQVIGGYQQVPRGLWSHPSKLDVRPNKVVTKISYKVNGSPNGKARIYLDDGEVITADKVVLTAPLGVLKSKSITFSPPLPAWKTGAIDRLGFGTMNKVILVFEKPFWDVERDMIGLLREPAVPESLSQADYASSRGRFYLFWNCMKTSGLPMLIALMAGDSAHHAEALPDSEILHEVTSQLRNIFKGTAVPDPLETIITRWGQDRFSRGSYSYVAAESLPGDYDLMARSIGNLYFAGEATCGTHPATVHGAYLSGLRVAKEVLESVIGPIKVPTPLVVSKTKTPSTLTPVTPPAAAPEQTMINPKKRKGPQSSPVDHPNSTERPAATPSGQGRPVYEMAFVEEYRRAISRAIQAELGDPEKQPRKEPINPFLLFQKDYWFVCKARCDEVRRRSTGNPAAKTPRDEVRQALGQMWREASEEVRRRYLDQIEINRKINNEKMSKWKERITVWERHSAEIKDRWCAANPYSKFVKEMDSQKVANAKVRTYKLN